MIQLLGQNHGINDVNNAIGGEHVGLDHMGIIHFHNTVVDRDFERLAVDRGGRHGRHVCRHDFFRNHVVGENSHEGGFVLRLQEGYLGRMTVSTTWMTPLLAAMSALTTVASLTITLPSSTLIFSSLPLTAFAVIVLTSAAITLPGKTW